jgi:hypothetical protein
MDAITSGNRPTKSGKPPGRPERVIPAPVLQVAKDALAGGKPFAEALRLVNAQLVGDAVDPATVKKRSVGKGTLARALGLWSESAQNPNPPKTPSAQKVEVSGVIGPVVGDHGKPVRTPAAEQPAASTVEPAPAAGGGFEHG